MVGRKFGRFTVISFSHTNKHRSRCYLCRCECGTEKVINGNDLQSGRTKSCGCYFRDRMRQVHSGSGNSHYSHGGAGTPLYRIWRAMLDRCYYPPAINYPHYGAKGVKVCDEWRHDFGAFQAWALANGYKEGLSIDRKETRGDYSPDNCQWLTRSENTAKGNRQRYAAQPAI